MARKFRLVSEGDYRLLLSLRDTPRLSDKVNECILPRPPKPPPPPPQDGPTPPPNNGPVLPGPPPPRSPTPPLPDSDSESGDRGGPKGDSPDDSSDDSTDSSEDDSVGSNGESRPWRFRMGETDESEGGTGEESDDPEKSDKKKRLESKVEFCPEGCIPRQGKKRAYPWEEYYDGLKKPRWEKYIDRKRKLPSDDDDNGNFGANKKTRLN